MNLGEAFDGRAKIVRLNVDHSESNDAMRRYGVRATPSFVLLSPQGEVRGQTSGWPGYQAFVNGFDQLLAEGS